MGVIVLEKTDAETLRDVFGKRAPKLWFRFRSCMVKIFDRYYFKEMADLDSQLEKHVLVRNDITTMKQISDLMAEHQNTIMPDDEL